MKRSAEIRRTTQETDILIRLNLDGSGQIRLDYPIGFMNHMLTTFARHGLFDLEVQATGDIVVDQHHLVEDTGIVLGQCFAQALGEKRGIRRTGTCFFPMDETLARAVVDLCGRPFLVFDALLSGIPLVSGTYSFQTDTVEDFWQGFAQGAGATIHLDILRGRSDHHKIEALFKAGSCALKEGVSRDPRILDQIPSTKGVLA
ncbi:MAG: imidazoleglycerol-phosphate dehydratase HisB [Spirochaetaceae bacterium]|jgi:imidazoleglycerol-phosphate dehydratase|nr:imidazoleglycerol-phosphate dehydratase HisB [Spirochaetaceae bacterium]